MKTIRILLLACMLCTLLACAKTPAPEPETAPAVAVPETVELKLLLPLGTRDDVAKTLPAYTAGFVSNSALTFTVVSADPAVAEGVLKDDGALLVIAHGTGETKLTVTAQTASGERNAATVSVAVRDARRTLALIVLGVLSVALLVLLGKPSAGKKPEPAPEPAAEEAPDPVVIFEEEPKNDPERS